MGDERCSVEGCARKRAVGRKGLCNPHCRAEYKQRHGNTCSVCGRGAIAKGLCAAHHSRRLRGGDLGKPMVPRYKGTACDVAGCGKPIKGRGLCRFHYHRWFTGVPLDAPPRGPRPDGYISGWGYRVLVIDGKRHFEHRLVVEKTLGRRLLRHESVHHKNGDRLDNRPENLELWSKKQPSGQRTEDLLAWAREIIQLYGGTSGK